MRQSISHHHLLASSAPDGCRTIGRGSPCLHDLLPAIDRALLIAVIMAWQRVAVSAAAITSPHSDD